MKKKMIIVFLSTSISLLFSSCSTILEIITGDRQCIYPNCTERGTSNSAYWHYKIFCVNGNTGFKFESRIFNFIHLQNEEDYERKESSSA